MKTAQLTDPLDPLWATGTSTKDGGALVEKLPHLALNVRNSPAPGTETRGAHRPLALALQVKVGVMLRFRRLGLFDGRSSIARGRFLDRIQHRA